MAKTESEDLNDQAVVVGAGIGGLSAALGLHAAGWEVRVLEQAAGLDPVGAGLSLWPNGVRALESLGVRLPDYAVKLGSSGLRTSSGRWLSRSDTTGYPARYGAPLAALHRADLQQILLRHLPLGTVSTGTRVTALRQGEGGVEVEHSGERTRAAVVVIADGLTSATRHLVAGRATRPRYAGYTAWRGVTQSRVDVAGPVGMTESWGRGERFGVVPLADGRIYWFATANVAEHSGSREGAVGEYAEVLRRFTGWHAPIAQVLAATSASAVMRHDVYDLQPAPTTYVSGRLVLLGDAAHAMTPNLGQGACQALEDAATLAALLSPGADPGPALARYDLLRRPRSQLISTRSRQVGRVAQLDGKASTALRQVLMGLLPAGATERSLATTLNWQMADH